MPRRARITLANTPHHNIQRGNNRSACFYVDDDYLQYLDWLQKYSLEHHCRVHAYVLMTNHVHLPVTPETSAGLARMMKSLGQIEPTWLTIRLIIFGQVIVQMRSKSPMHC